MDDAGTWWRGVPIVTKYLLVASFGLTLSAHFGIVSPMTLIFLLPNIYQHFEIWRLVTPFFYLGRLSFNFLIDLLFLYRYSESLETTVFAGRIADYVYMLVVCGIALLLVGAVFGYYVFAQALIMVITYVWSRKNADTVVSFMFGLRFKAAYLPWVLIIFTTLMGGNPIMQIIGVLVGHVYFYLTDIYPLTGGRRLLATPQFFLNWFPREYGGGVPPAGHVQQGQQHPQGHQWGAGRPLGR